MKKIYIFDLDDTILMHNIFKGRSLDYNKIQYNHKIDTYLSSLNGTKYIYTNGTYGHADKVLKQMKLCYHFKMIYARDTLDSMKPTTESFLQVYNDILSQENITKRDPHRIYFYDDLLDNLLTAYNIGWTTIWIHPDYSNQYKYYYVNQSHHLLENIFN